MTPTFFRSPAELRAWFEKHHATARELLVGFYKKGSGRPSIDWPQSVDEALSVGWIDGIRRSFGAESYTIRFTPRKPTSIWSAINIKRATALAKAGRMRPSGLAAFKARRENRSGIYSYEKRPERLPSPYDRMLRENKAAHTYFHAQPASYRRAVIWWVISAKQEDTQMRRIRMLIALSTRGEWHPQLRRRTGKTGTTGATGTRRRR
jgi:uncharacterized protein YdeI (YjbR/CyaY-like superfamily)